MYIYIYIYIYIYTHIVLVCMVINDLLVKRLYSCVEINNLRPYKGSVISVKLLHVGVHEVMYYNLSKHKLLPGYSI